MDDLTTDEHPDTDAISEHTVRNAQQDAIPAEHAGGPPRRDELTVSPTEMGRRTLEDATETPPSTATRD